MKGLHSLVTASLLVALIYVSIFRRGSNASSVDTRFPGDTEANVQLAAGHPAGHGEFGALLEPMLHKGGSHWRMPLGNETHSAALASKGAPRRSAVLLAVPTANVWEMTHAMLNSLAVVNDDFDLLVMDDLSADGTDRRLAARQVHYLQPARSQGLTQLWNMAYRFWKQHGYQYLFISNNDVLIPNGVIDRLVQVLRSEHRGSTGEPMSCDLVTPLSTVKGKGHLGSWQGIEVVHHLSAEASRFVNNPLNYARVQEVLDRSRSVIRAPNKKFNGFFFGMSHRMMRVERKDGNLFDPRRLITGQELLLILAMREAGLRSCLHTGTFVYHYKGATVPLVDSKEREKFRHSIRSSDAPPAELVV